MSLFPYLSFIAFSLNDKMRGHTGAGCVYSGPAEGVCRRSLLSCDLEDSGFARTVWPCLTLPRARTRPACSSDTVPSRLSPCTRPTPSRARSQEHGAASADGLRITIRRYFSTGNVSRGCIEKLFSSQRGGEEGGSGPDVPTAIDKLSNACPIARRTTSRTCSLVSES